MYLYIFLTPYPFAIIIEYEWTDNNFNDLLLQNKYKCARVLGNGTDKKGHQIGNTKHGTKEKTKKKLFMVPKCLS